MILLGKPESADVLRKSNALYPADFPTVGTTQARFHLHAWVEGIRASGEDHRGEIGYDDFPIFTDRRDRDRFMKWWSAYREWFVMVDPFTAYLPSPGTSPLRNAAFIAEPLPTDGGKREADTLPGLLGLPGNHFRSSNTAEVQFLESVVRVWSWIAVQCKRPVYRIQGGWLFSNSADAVRYKVFTNAPFKEAA
jgi:hypothetical protein